MNRSHIHTRTQCSYENISSRVARLQSASKDTLKHSSSGFLDRKISNYYCSPNSTSSVTKFRTAFDSKQNILTKQLSQPQIGKVTKNIGIRKYNSRYANVIKQLPKSREITNYEQKIPRILNRNILNEQVICDTNKYFAGERLSMNSNESRDRTRLMLGKQMKKSRSISKSSKYSNKSSRSKSSSLKRSQINAKNDYILQNMNNNKYQKFVPGRVYTKSEIQKISRI